MGIRPGRAALLAVLAFVAVGVRTTNAGAEGGPGLAWGDNFQTQLGAGFKSGHQASPVTVRGLANATAIAAAYHFSLALISGGTVKSWGGNDKGQLGDGTRVTKGTPVEVKGLSEVKSVSAAGAHALALKTNGTVLSWGAAEYGERGNGESGSEAEAKEKEPNRPPRDIPALIPNLEHVTAISSGGASNFALLENGTLMAWGEDANGILGLGEKAPEECKGEVGILPCSTIPRPVKLPEGAKVVALSGGGEGAYVLLSTGELLAWGNNSHGQLGNGTTNSSSTPGKVELSKLEAELKTKLEVVAISGGDLFALALLKTGEVIGWGANGVGELGGTSTEECKKKPNSCSKTPKLVSGLGEVSAVSAGRSFSLTLKAGTIYSFGDNQPWGQLGIGNTTNTNVPTAIGGIEPIARLAAGEQHSLALLQAGTEPPPEFTVVPEKNALNVIWTISADEYHIRWRTPPKSGKWSPVVKRSGPCNKEKVCNYVISGLSKVLYEVQFITFVGGVQQEIRKAEATPE
jgi:alpha-tubulin suppressor-like RCC1 family protein